MQSKEKPIRPASKTPAAVRRPDARIRAPRRDREWEPTPLQIPSPEERGAPHAEPPAPTRGVVIIDYGSPS